MVLVAVRGRRDSDTSLAKVTTSYKALPCSHPVCASAVCACAAHMLGSDVS